MCFKHKGSLSKESIDQTPVEMATAGRFPPDQILPSTLHPTQYNIHATPQELIAGCLHDPPVRPPDYLAQAEDFRPPVIKPTMGPLDSWATGRPDYSFISGLTGVRPTVDKYSITRFSEGEWRRHNRCTLLKSQAEQNKSEEVEWFALKAMDDVRQETDKNQADNTRRLNRRERDVYKWEAELRSAAERMTDEIELMEVQQQRLQKALMMVLKPSSIAGECLDRRTGRLDIELVRDNVEDALTIELSLSREVREQLQRTLRAVENQLVDDRSAKRRLEYDWSDKRHAHELVAANSSLNNRSRTILFNPGATIFQSEQSTVELWNRYVGDLIEEAERIREKSAALRATLDAVLVNAARDMRSQADRVDLALSKRIAATEGMHQQLEIEMRKIMRRQLDAENLMPKIEDSIRRLDVPMKVAQTRLTNKAYRVRVENCRDPAQYGLVDEVKTINEGASELRRRLGTVEETHRDLLRMRGELERDLLLKRNTLQIDRELLNDVRSRFPSANALSGYMDV